MTTQPTNTKFSSVQAVKLCKLLVQAQPALAQSAKASLEKTCTKAAGGNEAAFRRIAYKVCVSIINYSHVPAGSAREQALAACKAQ